MGRLAVSPRVASVVLAIGFAVIVVTIVELLGGCSLLEIKAPTLQPPPVMPDVPTDSAGPVVWENAMYYGVTSVLAAAAAFREVRKRWKK